MRSGQIGDDPGVGGPLDAPKFWKGLPSFAFWSELGNPGIDTDGPREDRQARRSLSPEDREAKERNRESEREEADRPFFSISFFLPASEREEGAI